MGREGQQWADPEHEGCNRHREREFADMRLWLPVNGTLMNQDMKSNYLDGPIGYMEFTSGPFYRPKGLFNSACQRTFIKQSLQSLECGCRELGRADFQSPKMDGMMLRA